ncbi:hypothetical protein PIROE2DRAFT_5756 [Piromyces sp. E2]|nr:hypothetical protein PIROE2DRAFT_5756 [Piromyces sp. E2]|eukprot:OUM66895.1 hypothetical protein PIROE2DRAFT_5756 [Piromyces sp. E2]
MSSDTTKDVTINIKEKENKNKDKINKEEGKNMTKKKILDSLSTSLGSIYFGKSYILMKRHGVDAVLNDVLVSKILIIGKLMVIVLSSFVSYMIMTVTAKIDNTVNIMMHVVVAYTVSETVFSAVTSVLTSAISTLFVGICNDLKCLKMSQPEFYDEIAKMNPTLIIGVNEEVSEYVDVGIKKTHNILEDLIR